MSPKFNIDRPKISDDEINKHKNFDHLVEQFKQQSLKQARGDESWWKNKRIRYSTVIAGVTVVCTVTYFSLFNNSTKQKTANETLITQKTENKNTTSAPGAFIREPSQKLKIGYTSYKVSNDKGATITHATASKIKIPKNSFVDKNGKDIVGDVTIEYREFHDMGDVIVSGIPMAYDSAGVKYNLETAGMFDIRGSKDGEPVFIKKDKDIEVELASKTNENKFNQYYLDTLDRNWHYIKKDKTNSFTEHKKDKDKNSGHKDQKTIETLVAKDPKLSSLQNEIKVMIPKKIDSVKVVYTRKTEKLASPKEPSKPERSTGRPSFVIDGGPDFPELEAFKNAVFEVGDENKNYSKELHDITWSSVTISQGPVKGKNYILNLSYRKRTEKLIVYPVLSGADYNRAQKTYEEKLQDYNDLFAKKQAEEKRLMDEMTAKQAVYMAQLKKKEEDYKNERAKLLAKYNLQEQNELASNFNALGNQDRTIRIFSVARFGIYNSDCPHPSPAGASVDPVFVLNGRGIQADIIYLVDHSAKTVYSFNNTKGFKIKYDPAGDYSLCVFNKSKMFLCNKTGFKEGIEKESSHFVVTPLPDAADNLVDFKKALEL